MKKKALSLLLTLSMLLSLVPAFGTSAAATVYVCAVGSVDGTKYATIQAAVDATPNNTATTIYLIADDTENVTIASGKKIILDLNGHVLKGGSNNNGIVITNNGTLTITDSNTAATHNFKVDSDGLWTLTEETENAKAFESLTSIPAADDIITVSGGCITGGNTSGSKSGAGIRTYDGGTVNLQSGNIIGNRTDSNGGGLYFYKGTFTMSGGIVAGNVSAGSSYGGGGVFLDSSTLDLSAGKISFNSAINNGAGGVYNYSNGNSSSITMSGGTISYNMSKKNGGGVTNYGSQSSFTMSGGTICGNTANSTDALGGGGVYNNDAAFNLSGNAAVSENKAANGGGIYLYAGTVTLGGSVKVTGNTKLDGTTANNLYLVSGKTVSIADGGLTDGASIGVTMYSTTGTVTAAVSADYSSYFAADNAAYGAYNSGSGSNQKVKIGNETAQINETGEIYSTVQAAVNDAANGQTIKMLKDSTEYVTVNANKTITLDLNGNMLLAKENTNINQSVIRVKGNVTLVSNNSDKVHYFKYEKDGVWKTTDADSNAITVDEITDSTGTGAVIKVTGGCIANGFCNTSYDDIYPYGGGVFVYAGGTLNAENVAFVGNKSSGGGALYCAGTATLENCAAYGNWGFCGGAYYNVSGSLTVSGGSVRYNTASTDAGGAVHANGGTFTANGATFSNNKSFYSGGGAVRVSNSAAVSLTNCTITGNSAEHNGGGIYLGSGTVTLGGTTTVIGNTKFNSTAANNLYLPSDKTVTVSTETPLTTGASIGVTTATAPTKGSPVTFTSNGTADDVQYFHSDNNTYYVKHNTDHLALSADYAITNGAPEANKAANHGYVTVSDTSAVKDETVTLTAATPDVGYHAGLWTVYETDYPAIWFEVTDNSFTMPGCAVTVSMKFFPDFVAATGKFDSKYNYEINQIAKHLNVGGNELEDMLLAWVNASTNRSKTYTDLYDSIQTREDAICMTAIYMLGVENMLVSEIDGVNVNGEYCEFVKCILQSDFIYKNVSRIMEYTAMDLPDDFYIAGVKNLLEDIHDDLKEGVTTGDIPVTSIYDALKYSKDHASELPPVGNTYTIAANAIYKIFTIACPDAGITLENVKDSMNRMIERSEQRTILDSSTVLPQFMSGTDAEQKQLIYDYATYCFMCELGLLSGDSAYSVLAENFADKTYNNIEEISYALKSDTLFKNIANVIDAVEEGQNNQTIFSELYGTYLYNCNIVDFHEKYTDVPNDMYKAIGEIFDYYSITVDTEIANGTIVSNTKSAGVGERVTVTATPSDGYVLDTLTYTPSGEGAIAITETKSFIMPAKAVTVKATFAHAHTWTYTASKSEDTLTDNDTIKAKCITGCDYTGTDLTVTLTASNASYDGNLHGAVTSANTIAGQTNLPAIKYVGVDGTTYEESETAPTAAGIYRASITVDDATASVEYTIAPVSLTISTATISDKIYDGKNTATVTEVTFSGLQNAESLTKDTDYTVSGVFDSTDATGTNAATQVTVTVTLKNTANANNYYISGTKVFAKTIGKADQSKTASAPTLASKTDTVISINAVTVEGETVEYAISTTNSTPATGWQTGTTFDGRTAGTTYYIFSRVQESINYKAGAASTALEVKTKAPAPDAPAYTVDFTNEQTMQDIPATVEYSTDNVNWVVGSDAKVTMSPNTTYYFRVKGTEDTLAGNKQSITIPARPATPSVSVNYTAETANTAATQEYSVDGGETWTNCTADMNASDWAGKTVQLRVKATASCYKSGAQSITVAARPQAPALTGTNETVANKQDAKLSGVTSTMEYKLGTGAWTSGTGADIVNPENADIEVRVKATENVFVGNIQTITFPASTVKLSVTIGEAVQNVIYNGLVTKPADPTKTGYTFGGWYKDEACETAWNFGDDRVTNTMTLYAKWIENSETKAVITGTVTDGTNPVSGAVVELWLGTEKVAAAVTNASGVYTFDNVENGLYNIVIVKDGKTKTAMVNVNQVTNFTADATLPAAAVNSKVELKSMNTLAETAKADVSDVVVGGVEAVAEAENPSGSDKITIVLTVEPKAENNTDAAQTAIKTTAGSKTVEFVDFTLTKQINDGEKNDIGSTNNKILTITLPFDTTGIDVSSITVYRHHDTATALTKESARMTTPADGHFYVDTANKLIYIYASQFSTYAIGYTKTSSQNTSGGSVSTYSVTIANTANGCVTASTKSAYAGNTVTLTVKADDGYKLGTLTVTDAKGNAVTVQNDKFTMPASNVTVSATFVSVACPQDATCVYAKFIDADTKAWYHDGVHFCVENGYMNGVGNDKFEPNSTLSRAMIVTMLWRMEDSPVANYAMTFTDVPADLWYTEAIRWAQSNKVVEGYSTEAFGPNDDITREQLAAILWRYAKYKGYDVSVGEDTNILSYDDAICGVSSWAMSAMQWACGASIINGIGTRLEARGNATRAQAACMIQRFCENVAK